MTKAAKSAPPVFVYSRMVLVRRPDNTLDVCDPITGAWANFATERRAKWNATAFSNMCSRFGRTTPNRAHLDMVVAHTDRTYPYRYEDQSIRSHIHPAQLAGGQV